MTDRLSADKQYVVDLVQNDIDNSDALNFKSSGERADIYLFAIALGVNEGYQTSSNSRQGFILESAVRTKPNFMSFIYSIALNELRKSNQENKINDKDIVFGIAEGYANTGFKVMREMIPDFDNYDEELFTAMLIKKMDDKYAEIISDM